MPFLSLPEMIIEEIIAHAIDCPQNFDIDRENKVIKVKAECEGEAWGAWGRPIWHTHLALLLTSRYLSSITQGLLLRRGIICAIDNHGLAQFMDAIGEDKLFHVKNIDWALGKFLFEDDVEDPHDIELVERFERLASATASLMERLPTNLRTLRIGLPDRRGEHWPWSNTWGSWPMPDLAKTLSRLRSLRTLALDFNTRWAYLEPIWLAPPPTAENPTRQPMFSLLRSLYLSGKIRASVTEAQMVRIFSEEQLPSLQNFQIDSMVLEIKGEPGEWPLTPQVLLEMHPLVEFAWMAYDCFHSYHPVGELLNPPLSGKHLAALESRHRQTLRTIILSYNNYFSDCAVCTHLEPRVTKDDLA